MARRLILVFCLLGFVATGCSGSDESPATGGGGGSGGTGGTIGIAIEWPPDATVYFDENRVFHADCTTDEDCAMALGYYHAFDRFAQMDIRRRFATGRFAGILEPSIAGLLADDFADLRALFSTRDGQPAENFLYAQASPKTRALLEAYAIGVNQWIQDVRDGENNAKFPREFTHPLIEYGPDDIPEWLPEDCVAAVLALVENLTNEETLQVDAAEARAAIADDAKFSDLWAVRPLEESAILPLDWTPPASPTASVTQTWNAIYRRDHVRPVLQRLQEKLARIDGLREMVVGPGLADGEIGSNNWVIGPSRATNGNALLCNDPHLGMTQPATWYVAHLDAVTNGEGEIHTAGMTFAGLPWVIVGHNERIAWGVTTTNMDFSDVYVETLSEDGDGVVFRGREVPFTRVPFTLEFSDGSTQEKELLFVPHHGAVREIDRDLGTALTLRWTGNDLDTDINVLTDLARASSTEEARQALLQVTTIGQNWVVIDSENNIGWYPYNRLPKRTWATDLSGDAPAWLPLDGSSGDYEWEEYFAIEELPQATNPESGYICTANNDMTGALFDEDPTTLPSGASQPPYQSNVAAGFRHKQIVNLIEAVGDQHTRETMDAIISDVYSLIGERMTPGIVEIATDPQTSPGVNGLKVISALQNWDFTCPSGVDGPDSESSPLVGDSDELLASSGCAAFHAMLIELRARIEENENAPSGRKPSIATYHTIVDPDQLIAGDVYWDNPGTPAVETRFDVMSASLQTVGDFLAGFLGADETQWAWGRLHGLQLQSDLSSLSSVFADYDNPPPGEPLFANDGGLFTVDVANPGQTDFVQLAGPSTRFVCEASPVGPSCTFQLPGGQSADIDSEHYEDLLFPYLENQPIELVFDIGEVAAGAEPITFE